jgi:antitoxin CcdA
MRKYNLVAVKERRLVEWTCSVCKKDLLADKLEAQEVFSFSQVGGYSSVFGDGAEIYIDVCQHCMKEKLGEFCTVL